jgi:hypothetical protein
MEEFALCWNKLKFAENLSTGFQSLYDRGDFVDCTIACDGQILQCHKLVLAICSPYFREIFMNNPCRHPISEYQWRVYILRGGRIFIVIDYIFARCSMLYDTYVTIVRGDIFVPFIYQRYLTAPNPWVYYNCCLRSRALSFQELRFYHKIISCVSVP